MLTPAESGIPGLGDGNIVIGRLEVDGIASTSGGDGGVLVEERGGINVVVKEGLLDFFLSFELLALAHLLAVFFEGISSGVTRAAGFLVFFAEGGVGHEIDEEGFQITQGNDSEWLGSAIGGILGGEAAMTGLDNFLALSFGNGPEEI